MNLANLFTLSGRNSRKDYIIISLAIIAIGVVLSAITDYNEPPIWVSLVSLFLGLGVGLPAGFRRLHDTGRSGWWLLVNLIPIIGSLIMLVVLWILPGDDGLNEYGLPNNTTPFPALHE